MIHLETAIAGSPAVSRSFKIKKLPTSLVCLFSATLDGWWGEQTASRRRLNSTVEKKIEAPTLPTVFKF